MKFSCLRQSLLQVVSLVIVCTGFAQVSHAGVIETSFLADQEDRATSIARVEVLLASAEVARQFEKLGVDQALVAQRIQAFSNAELLLLEEQMENGAVVQRARVPAAYREKVSEILHFFQ